MSAPVKVLVPALAFALAGCAIGPDYERPPVELPERLAQAQSAAPMAERWWTVFGDPALDALIDEAIAANRDLAAAAQRIEQARAQFTVTRADQLPAFGIEGSRSRDRSSERGSFPPPPESIESNTNRLVLRASWELDFWGKYRRATEAARAEYRTGAARTSAGAV